LRIAVCMVMVPKLDEVFVHRRTGELRATPAIVNPADENALELALTLKDSRSAEVVAVSLGDESTERILRKAVASGCDHAYHLFDSRFANSDPLATARIFGAALKKIGPDIVVCGSEAMNGGQTGPRIAECLNIPHFIDVTGIVDNTPKAKRVRDGKEEVLEVKVPALITVCAGVNTPRTPKAVQIMKAHSRDVLTRWGLDDLVLDVSHVGERGSCTKVVEVFE